MNKEALVARFYRACCQSGHVISAAGSHLAARCGRPNEQYHYPQIVERFYQLGILPDWCGNCRR
ncbi:DUF2090 domain-containing protein [Salmonella enterica subsp. enterica]|nr:DUF2090 domain-containing protein [Salmonella enterica subsp. enterica]